MRVNLFFLLCFLIMFSNCSVDNNSGINKSDFANKSFDLLIEIRKDTIYSNNLTISFNDSIFRIVDVENDKIWYGNSNQNWNLRKQNGIDFLVMNNNVILIKRLNDSTYKGPNLNVSGVNFKLSLRNTKWKHKDIQGKWVEEKYYNKPESFFPPYPLQLLKKEYSWPPFYEIFEDKIVSSYYSVNESHYEINNSNEYLFMRLNNSMKGTEVKWRIKEVTDSTMVINYKLDKPFQDYNENEFSGDIRLIKLIN